MKKAIVLALAVILTLSLAVPVAAVTSPTAPETSKTATAPLPELVEKTITGADNVKIVIDLYAANDVTKLSDKARKDYKDAQDCLKDAVPTGMKTQYFFYVTTSLLNPDGTTEPYNEPVDVTFKIADVSKVVVKQFVDGEWKELEAVLDETGTVTVKGVVDGPMAIFTA